MKIPLLSGVVTSPGMPDFELSYPLNMEPVAIDTKIAQGYLRAAMGVRSVSEGPGKDRGGIEWNGVCYRVMGTSLVSIGSDDVITVLGEVGDGAEGSFDYGFDRLAVASGGDLFYYDGAALVRVTDPDLGTVNDVIWIDGYFMATDGSYVVVTELSDPMQVKPLKYGSAETDPDPITGLLKLRGEVYVLGRYTIQVFGNVGGTGFPFADRRGAGISIGCVGPHAKTLFADTFAFVGSRRNDPLGVYVAGQGSGQKISTRAVDDDLATLSDPAAVTVEARNGRDEQRLYVHLPTHSWVYLASASTRYGTPVWYRVASRDGGYRPRNAVLSGGRWLCGDMASNAVGVLAEDTSQHFGTDTPWQFEAGLLYNASKGGLVHKLELVGLPGRGGQGSALMSLSDDGVTWGPETAVGTGVPGQRAIRVTWRPHRRFRNWLAMRFRGLDASSPAWTALEAEVVGLSV